MNTRVNKTIFSAITVFLAAASIHAATPPADPLPVERYALYVACNDGGKDRETLRYAGSDATKLAKTMNEIGGIKQYNSMILIDPAKEDIAEAFATFTSAIVRNKGRAKRTEFLFYYSGHSDEKSFLLGNEAYDYDDLKTALNKVPSDVHVVMLDSCFSGNFVRSKGGSKQKPFLMDDSTVVQGHAYLSSSSDKELSQESDSIKSSYFTHALISGLRGAADTSGDGKVSLNELYHYAFNETLSDTELSTVGPQHPSYNITLVGSGDLVLTDITEAESSIMLPMESEGKFFVRDLNGVLISEINKIKGTGVSLALEAGMYSVVLVTSKTTMQGAISINKGEHLTLNPKDLTAVQKTQTRSRGDYEEPREWENTDDADYIPLAISIFPGLSYPAVQDNARVSIGLFMASNANIKGIQGNYFMGIVTNDMFGVQGSGFMNIASGDVQGIQGAGFMNISGRTTQGLQGAGFMNIAKGSAEGLQGAGFMNITTEASKGLQGAGFMNISKGGYSGLQVSGFANIASGSSEGLQGTGFLNVAGKMDGVQASGFLNVANEINFAQIGVVNIANKNTGIALGVLNFIADGIMSPAVYIDTAGWAYVQYQGGTEHFYTTFLAGMNTDWCQRWDYSNVVFGAGIGSRLPLVQNISLDVELLWKNLVDYSKLEECMKSIKENMTEEEQRAIEKNFESQINVGQLPSLRGTLNLSFAKHFTLFGAASVDAKIHGFNDAVFTRGQYTSGSWEMAKNRMTLYPAFSFGLKF